MPGHRMERITEDIRRELSDILRHLKDPRVSGLISIVKVEVSSDLSYSKVYVSILGGNGEDVMKGLKSASGFVRKELSERLHIRKTPEIKFIEDESIAKSARIAELLNHISENRDENKEE